MQNLKKKKDSEYKKINFRIELNKLLEIQILILQK